MKQKPKKKNTFLPILAGIIVLLLTIKIFFISKPSNKLQTYTDSTLHFSLQYPSKYFLKIYPQGYNQNLIISTDNTSLSPENIDLEYTKSIFSIQFLSNFIGPGRIETPEEWIKSLEKTGMKYEQTTINGRTAYFRKYDNNRTDYLIYVENGPNYDRYDISISDSDDGRTIFSTFKFID